MRMFEIRRHPRAIDCGMRREAKFAVMGTLIRAGSTAVLVRTICPAERSAMESLVPAVGSQRGFPHRRGRDPLNSPPLMQLPLLPLPHAAAAVHVAADCASAAAEPGGRSEAPASNRLPVRRGSPRGCLPALTVGSLSVSVPRLGQLW